MDTFGGHGGGRGSGGIGAHVTVPGGGHPLGGGRGRGRNWWSGGGYVLGDGYYDDVLDDVIDNYDEEEDSDLGGMISG
jgi:hypothetical protein